MILNVVWNSPLNQKNKITPPSLRLVYDMHARIRCERARVIHPKKKPQRRFLWLSSVIASFFFSSFLYSNRTQNIFNIVWISRVVKVRSRSSSHPPHNTSNPAIHIIKITIGFYVITSFTAGSFAVVVVAVLLSCFWRGLSTQLFLLFFCCFFSIFL